MAEARGVLDSIRALVRAKRYRVGLHAVRHMIDYMKNLMKSKCSECGGEVRRKSIAQEFEKEGVKIKLSGLKAWVCSRCGEVYFEPGGAQQVVEAVNSLFKLARNEKQHKGTLSAHVC